MRLCFGLIIAVTLVMTKQMILKTVTNSVLQLAITACFILASSSSLLAAEYQSLASIRMQTESFIANYPYESPYPPRFQISKLDSRLRLKVCPEALAVDFVRQDIALGNTAILVRCPIESGWKIHLPVRIDVFEDVIVTAKPLLKGQNIDTSAVTFQKHNIALLRNGYYVKNSRFEQLQARRNLKRGAVLTPKNLSPRLMVRSGQQVTLVLDYNGLQIKSTGTALKSATLGQVVKVRNSQSLRVVEGIVSGEALVRVSI
jgi:flagella basal body P-ring formation protein FlgA